MQPNGRIVVAGSFDNLVNLADGSVWGWGWNCYGQLGDGTTVDRGTPVRAVATGPRAIVSAGGVHSLAT